MNRLLSLLVPRRALRWGRLDVVPGACGDPACPVLHANPAKPIHPPWYVDSREEHR